RLNALTTTGNVILNVVDGNLLDANSSQTVDTRTRDDLLGGVWKDLGLTSGTGANQKVLDTIASYKATKEQEYRTYWKYRNLQGGAYDPTTLGLTTEETAYYSSIGFNLQTLINARQQEYRDL